jgi:hypothetical protein
LSGVISLQWRRDDLHVQTVLLEQGDYKKGPLAEPEFYADEITD